MNDLHIHDIYFYFTASGVWLAIGWAFVMGAAIGSFFNVVAYRLPRGMSLSRPGSRCPACGRPIRWYDNVPILGWLVLKGRCRDCRAAISPRYPLVELLVAAASAVVAWTAIVPAAGPAGGELYTLDPALVGYRLLLVYTLTCAALLEFAGHRAALRLLVAVLVGGAILPMVWPELRSPPSDAFAGRVYECGGVLAAAWLLGLLAWPMLVEKTDSAGIRGAVARVVELALVGVFLGLAAVAAVAVFAAAVCFASGLLARVWPAGARFGWAVALVAGTLIWMTAGPEIAARWLPAGGSDARMTLATAGAIVAVLGIAARVARPATQAHGATVAGDRD